MNQVLRNNRIALIVWKSALVTYVTAGYPTAQDTPDIMLGMEAGGAGTYIEQLVVETAQG
jgi:tryptophan synthase alpha subunit